MRGVPLYYNWRNLTTRRISNVLTALALALAILIIQMLIALVAGVQQVVVDSGSSANLVVMRQGFDNEILSQLTREEFDELSILPAANQRADGQRLVSPEVAAQFTFDLLDGTHQDVMVRGGARRSVSRAS